MRDSQEARYTFDQNVFDIVFSGIHYSRQVLNPQRFRYFRQKPSGLVYSLQNESEGHFD